MIPTEEQPQPVKPVLFSSSNPDRAQVQPQPETEPVKPVEPVADPRLIELEKRLAETQRTLDQLSNKKAEPQGNPYNYQMPQFQPKPPPDIPALKILEAVHQLLEGYHKVNKDVYPELLRQDVMRQINELRVFRDRLHAAPLETRQLIGLVSDKLASENQ